MEKIDFKNVQNSLDANCSNRTEKRKTKYKTTHLEQKKSKLLCKDSPIYDLVKESKENSFNLLNVKRKQKRIEDIEKGKMLFFMLLQLVALFFLFCL